MKPLAWGGSARREWLGNKNARKRRNCRKDGKRSFTSDKVCRYVNVEPKTNAAPYEGLLVGQKQSQRVRLRKLGRITGKVDEESNPAWRLERLIQVGVPFVVV